MTPKQKLSAQFINDNSVVKYEVLIDFPESLILLRVLYVDSRGVINNYTSEVMHCDFIYKHFLSHKARQHWEDYREYLLIKTEETYGTDWTPAISYKVGDRFILNGMICEAIRPAPERNFVITEINYGTEYNRKGWKVCVKKVLLKVQGTMEETYYLQKELIPSLGNYASNEDWYDALMKVVNK